MDPEGGYGRPLLGRPIFLSEKRSYNDRPWLYAYLTFVLISIVGGIFSFVNRNPNFIEEVNPEYLSHKSNCPVHPPPGHGRRLAEGSEEAMDADTFLAMAGWWVLGSVLSTLLLGVLFVQLVKRSPHTLMFAVGFIQVGIPLALAAYAFAVGAVAVGVLLAVTALLLVVVLMMWRSQLELALQLLGQAGHALTELPGILVVTISLVLVNVLLSAPLALGGAAGIMNGSVAPNPARADVHDAGNSMALNADACVDDTGAAVMCCVWSPHAWVPVHLTLVSVAILWTSMLVGQIKLFTISGAVGQWYFNRGATTSELAPLGYTRTSLGHALGPSLGSLCFASAVLTVIDLVRQAIRRAQRDEDTTFLARIALACFSFLLELADYITTFSTVYMSITGEAFLTAGRNAVSLLRRNLMDAFGVWWLPPLLLQSATLVFAFAWGVLVWFISGAMWHGKEHAAQASGLLGVISGITALLVLSFFSALLLNVVEALFVCYALDRDTGVVSDVAIHEVMSKLPTVGRVVENPGGEFAYAAPTMAPPTAPPRA